MKSASEYSNEEIYAFTASAEQYSEHPLGKAIVRCFKEKSETLLPAEQFKMIAGQGVSAYVNGKTILAGNIRFFDGNAIEIQKNILDEAAEYVSKGSTVIYTAVDGKLAGYLALADTIRNKSSAMISEIKEIDIQPVLLTGDNENAANLIARQLHIDEVYCNCLPEDKLNYIGVFQNKGEVVCMIGDGINDAPALKRSDVGIAMGGVGSDIAVDSADIALIDDKVNELLHLLLLSKRMMFTIKCNLSFSMLLNFAAIVRDYLVEMLKKDTLEPEDYTFLLVPVNIETESNSSYGSTVSYITTISPYVQKPAMVKLDITNAKIKLTYTRQYSK